MLLRGLQHTKHENMKNGMWICIGANDLSSVTLLELELSDNKIKAGRLVICLYNGSLDMK